MAALAYRDDKILARNLLSQPVVAGSRKMSNEASALPLRKVKSRFGADEQATFETPPFGELE
jgi:hypothetical protein